MVNQMDRRSFDLGASANAQEEFHRAAAEMEALIDQRSADVAAAMADYRADGVSEDYAGKERRWNNAANGVKTIIATLRASLGSNDQSATTAMQRARAAVDAIG